HIAGLLLAGFMVVLIGTGNLSFLNWLTIIPALACLDDSFWRRVLPRFLIIWADRAAVERLPCARLQVAISVFYTAVVAVLSIAPVKNLFFSDRQAMNGSFDKLHLVNTYGAFGSIDRERYELVFEGTSDTVPETLSEWREYEFKAKPTDPMRRPVVITPYHYRLDWAAWYPWSQVPGRNQWLPAFLWKLLHNDPGALSLLARNPFPEEPPKWVRVSVYRYRFAPLGQADGAWWQREHIRTYIRPVSVDSPLLRQALPQIRP
ncbi:MAG: lipase maturation factor family protein, partial [Prosthecobacter sp.]|nr:lipase maturation factor family protein [Prosthecobacter sp.]